MSACGYHFSAKAISRSKGQSSVSSVSYRTAERLCDEREGKSFDYTRKQGVEFVLHAAPKDAPEWAHEIGTVWNEVERAEKKKNATLALDYEVAFPHQLNEQQREFILKDFVREEFTRKGFMATAAIHSPSKDGDERNFHAHIMFSYRPLNEDGFARNKDRRFSSLENREETLKHLKERWAELGARQLERAGLDVDAERWRHGHKTLAEQSALARERGDFEYAERCDREPTRHLGPLATEIERDGRSSHRGDENREIGARNQDRAELLEIEKELADERKRQHQENRAKLHERAEAQKAEREQRKKQERESWIERAKAELANEAEREAKHKTTRERQKDSREKKEQQEQKPALQTVEKALDRTVDLADGLLDFFVGSTPKPKRQHEPERAKEEPKREAPTVEKALDRTIDAMDGLLDFFVGSTPKPKRQQQEEPRRYKTAAELHAQARARIQAEAERRASPTPEQRREEDRQREAERREREKRERGGRERERER
jgi:hypothetical protein